MGMFHDYVYQLERTFPQLAGAGSFFLVALALMSGCLLLYFATRRRVHLLASMTIGAYLLPFVL